MLDIKQVINSRIQPNHQKLDENKKTNPIKSTNSEQISKIAVECIRNLALTKLQKPKELSIDPFDEPITESDKKELENLIKREGRSFDWLNFRHNISKGQFELSKVLLTKKFNDKKHITNYSNYEINDIVRTCEKAELCKIAIPLIEKYNILFSPQIFGEVEKLKQNNPEKFEYVKNSENLLLYLNDYSDKITTTRNKSNYTNLIEVLPYEQLEKLESVCNDITKEGFTAISAFANLYFENKDAYDYLMSSKILREHYFLSDFKTAKCDSSLLTIEALKEIEKGYSEIDKNGRNRYIDEYVSNSNHFIGNTPQQETNKKELSSYLSQFKVENSFSAWRKDSTPAMFEQKSIAKTELEKITRDIVKLNYLRTKREMIVPSNGKFCESSFGKQKINLYDYIQSKSELTLADAMLVAKFGNQKFINLISEQIKKCLIIDDKFKSTSLSKDFVENWQEGAFCSTEIISKLEILKGCEGLYDAGTTGQVEFILNDHQKVIRYTDVKYNKETNTFELVGSVEKL